MKTNTLLATAVALAALALCLSAQADDITALSTGNWSDTNIWNTGTVPGINDDVDIPAGINVTVDTNVMIQFVYDGGTLTMGPNSSINVFLDQSIADTITLDTTAPGNTVIYSCNPWNTKQCNYYNLVLANTNYVDPFPPFYPVENFNNFSRYGATPMTIAGDMTLMGAIAVQQASGGAPITIGGNLTIGTNCLWDCSGDNLTIGGNLICYGLFQDLNGALGSNHIGGNVLIFGPGPSGYNPATGRGYNGWNVSDVTTWGVGGGLTNNGYIYGGGYGCINFNGSGVIGGSNTLTLPAIVISGTYAVGTTIILTTNTPTLNGTLIFDLARTNQIALRYNANGINTQTNYYSGNLVVVDSGAPPTPGKTYQLFNAASYNGTFAAQQFPALANGSWSWVDNLATSGSITVAGIIGAPTITLVRNGNLLNVTWDSATFSGYSVLAQTNGLGGAWNRTGSGTTSPYTVPIDPANKAVFYRLSNP